MRWLLLIMSAIMVAHNVVLRSWGIGSFASVDRQYLKMTEDGYFDSSPIVDPDGKPSFLRYARTPVGRFMHILPAGLWSVIAPMQLSPTFRSKHRTAHRRMGRLFIAMSVSMSIGIVPIVIRGANKLDEQTVPFQAVMLALTAYFLVAALLAVYHARGKRMAKHRVWILRHIAMGYSVHLQRLLGILTFGIYPYLIEGYTDHTLQGSHLRSIVFASYFFVSVFISVASMEVWLRHTSSSGAVLQTEGKTKTKTT
eukprot:jgi/Undpi1/7395/HiC_scaffold_22.g09868.m1